MKSNRSDACRARRPVTAHRLTQPLLIAVVLAFGLTPPALAWPGDRLDRNAMLGRKTFEEVFRQPTLDPTRWTFNFWYGDQKGPGSRLYGNQDAEIFSSLQYNGVDPFVVKNGQLIIKAAPTADRLNPLNGKQPYTSGMLTTFGSFTQRYGYFEAKLRADVIRGMWPAFWLLGKPPADKDKEIDVVEALGSTPGSVFQSTHYFVDGMTQHDARTYTTTGVDWSKDHVYGVLITPAQLIFYVDDRETYREANDGRFDIPMYMVVSLGVGPPGWNKNDPLPDFKGGAMTISYVRAYALSPAMTPAGR